MFEQFCCIFCIRSLDIVLLLLVCAPWPLGGNIAQKERDRRQDECQNLEIQVTQSCSKYKPLVALVFVFFPVTQIIAPLQSQTMRTKRGGLYSRDLSEGEADLALGPPR